MGSPGRAERIRSAVAAWEGTSAHPHRFGGTEFRLGESEIGHMHGETLLDVPFPRGVHDELIAAGLAELHHVLPDSGWISFRLKADSDVNPAIALLRRSYDVIAAQLARRKAQSAEVKRARSA